MTPDERCLDTLSSVPLHRKFTALHRKFTALHRNFAALHRLLLAWYRRMGRCLPWRDNGNPYHVLVSEIMLQQTQVSRVLEQFPEWIDTFPTIAALASARKRKVLLAWSGMGYNRRALNLHAAARIVVSDFDGIIPSGIPELQSLPGIGKYTAHAVACFAYRKRVAVVDTNIRRVLTRLSGLATFEDDRMPDAEAWSTATLLLPPRAYYNWNQALMDLGSEVCKAFNPRCDRCPLSQHCPVSWAASPVHRLGSRPKTKTQGVRETPRRIYRGKVVEFLRQRPRHRSNFASIGHHLRKDFSSDHYTWLMGILESLQRDGMVTLSRSGADCELI